jgi:hypothetical protein
MKCVVYIWDVFVLCLVIFGIIKLDGAKAGDLMQFHSFPDLIVKAYPFLSKLFILLI